LYHSNKLYLIEPDPSAFKPIASAELLVLASGLDTKFGTQNWAALAPAYGKAPDPGSKPVNVCQSYSVILVIN
jgi:hypothetical protein